MAQSPTQNIKIALTLNTVFTIIEFAGGIYTGSLAILSDALHDFGDSIALGAAYFAEKLSQKPADVRRTYGYQRLSLLSAFASAMVLFSGSIFILAHAVQRLFSPTPVDAVGMMGLSVLGILFNSLGAAKLKKAGSLNEKVIRLHLFEDVFGWGVIFVTAIAILVADLPILDSFITLGFTGFILFNVFRNLREGFNIFLQGVPKHIDLGKINGALKEVPGVLGVHDVHVWSLEGETEILTGHVVLTKKALSDPDAIRRKLKAVLADHHIEHSTLELESERFCSGLECELNSHV